MAFLVRSRDSMHFVLPSQERPKSYMVSYPRSGKSWIEYCCKLILGDRRELLYNAHYLTPHQGHASLDLTKSYDNVSILLMRNYKDAIFSNLVNTYKTNMNDVVYNLAAALLSDGCHLPYKMKAQQFQELEKLVQQPNTKTAIEDFFCNLKERHQVDDFLLDGYARIGEQSSDSKYDNLPWYTTRENDIPEPNNVFSLFFASSCIFHYHFALQMQRYYKLLDYYDKKSNVRPTKTLLIKYEDFMHSPQDELERLIDFWEKASLLTPQETQSCKQNLEILMTNIDYHKQKSLDKYRKDGHLALTQNTQSKSTPKDDCSNHFLTKIDDVFKKTTPTLYNKYLSDYAEVADV